MSLEIWKVLFLMGAGALLWPFIRRLSKKKEWISKNYENYYIPYTIGILLFIYSALYALLWQVPKVQSLLMYMTLLWLAGWADDLYGSDAPKGIRGHLSYFLKYGEWTTGFFKMMIIMAAAVFVLVVEERVWSEAATAIAFLCLVLSPHVCNLLDTRPLRVWKWTLLHFIVIVINSAYLLEVQSMLSAFFVFGVWGWIEVKKRGMLGDNGAAVAGAILAWMIINMAPLYTQIVLSSFYLFLTIIAEKFSLYELTLKIKSWRLWTLKTKNEGDL